MNREAVLHYGRLPEISMCVEDSVADHIRPTFSARRTDELRYAGLKGEADYKKAIQIIKDGGYATDTKYVSKICSIYWLGYIYRCECLIHVNSQPHGLRGFPGRFHEGNIQPEMAGMGQYDIEATAQERSAGG